MLYADSSFLVSCYIQDANAAAARAMLPNLRSPFAFTPLHWLEVRNALALGVFRQRLTALEAAKAWIDVRSDIRAGRLVRAQPDWMTTVRYSYRMAARFTEALGTRSLDILHVASAKELGIREFYTFDDRQKKLAVAQGMAVYP